MSAQGEDGAADDVVRLVAHVRGQVQGVGFRWWTRARALELGLVGSARNCPDGRVEVCAQGSRSACRALLEALQPGTAEGTTPGVPARPGRVTGVGDQWLAPTDLGREFREA